MAVVVDATSFITASEASKEAFKTATLLKTLQVNSLIYGENGVGKESLARFILPDAPVLDASQHNELLTILENVKSIIIVNLHNSPNIKKCLETINKNSVHVVATAKTNYSEESIEEIFSVKFSIPPLSTRASDVEALIDRYVQEAHVLFGGSTIFNKKNFIPDLSENANSLKRQVMIHYLLEDIQDKELMEIMEKYLIGKLGSNSDYRKFLHIYEAPLIRAGLQKFKSQLQLADKLGLNRNTLRKKISDNKKYL